MFRHSTRAVLAALVLLAVPVLFAACAGEDLPAAVSRMPPEEAAAAAARAEESAVRTMEVLRRAYRDQSDFSAGCFDAFELDREELCGDDYTAHLLFEWSDCLNTSGRILIDAARDTVPAGGQCDAATGYTTSHASTYDFEAALGDWGDHEVHVAVNTLGTLGTDGAPRMMESDVSVAALGLGSGGNPIYDAQVLSDWTTVWTTSSGAGTVIADGTSSVHLGVTQRDYDVTATGLTFREDCCHPVAGTVDVSAMVAGTSWQATAVFGPGCGEATVDGTAVTLAPCGL